MVANVLGSSLYNLSIRVALVGLGSGRGLAVDDHWRFGSLGVPIMLTLLLVPLLLRGSRLDRLQGAFVLADYALYTAVLLCRVGGGYQVPASTWANGAAGKTGWPGSGITKARRPAAIATGNGAARFMW